MRLLKQVGSSIRNRLEDKVQEERLRYLPLPCIRVASDLKVDKLGMKVNLFNQRSYALTIFFLGTCTILYGGRWRIWIWYLFEISKGDSLGTPKADTMAIHPSLNPDRCDWNMIDSLKFLASANPML